MDEAGSGNILPRHHHLEQVTELQRAPQEKKNLRTGIVLATIAAFFFLGFLVRRLFF